MRGAANVIDTPVHVLPVRKRIVFAAIAMGLGLAVALAISEVTLLIVEKRALPPSQPSLALLQANPNGTGSYRLIPNLRREATVKGRTVRIETNSYGMRWREVNRVKPAGVQRIALLGDSFAFGCWSSSIEKSFAGVLDAMVRTRHQEVLNFGVGGFGLDDMELLLHEEVGGFAPDYVVVTVFSGNDFRDTFLGLNKQQLVNGNAILDRDNIEKRLPARFRQPEDPRPDAAPDPNRSRAMLSHLRTFRWLYRALDRENPWIEFEPGRGFLSFTFWSRVPIPSLSLEASDKAIETLIRMREWGAAHGTKLCVVSIPFREQVYAAMPIGRDYDIALPQARVKLYAYQNDVPYLDLLPLLRERALRTGEQFYLAGDIHFNDRGHEFAGQAMAEWLANR
jgi:lysophospholipase L1-like esterase